MARVDTLSHFLTDVADAIREKKGTQATIQASAFDTEIENLPSGGGVPNLQSKEISIPQITEHTFISITPDEGYDGLSGVTIEVGTIDPRFFLIKDGTINTDNTGGFSSTLWGASARLQFTETGNGYLRLYSGTWGESLWQTIGDVDFSAYSKICVDLEYGSQPYGGMYFLTDDVKSDDVRYSGNVVDNNNAGSRHTIEFDLPSTIPVTMDKFYAQCINIMPEVKIYNMWLE